MATYNYEQIGSTLRAEWQELKELAKGKTIGQLKLEKFNVYEEGSDHIFFYYKRLRGMVFGIENNAPYIAEVMYAWNHTVEDWDELNLEKITLQPYELEQKEKPAISSTQIVVIDYTQNRMDIINTTEDFSKTDSEEYLTKRGYDINNIYWIASPNLQINFTL